MPKAVFSTQLPSGETVAFSLRKVGTKPFWFVRWRWNGSQRTRSTRKSDQSEAASEGRRIVVAECSREPVLGKYPTWLAEVEAGVARLRQDSRVSAVTASDVLAVSRLLFSLGVPTPTFQRSLTDLRLVWLRDSQRIAVEVGSLVRLSIEGRAGHLSLEWLPESEGGPRSLASFANALLALRF